MTQPIEFAVEFTTPTPLAPFDLVEIDNPEFVRNVRLRTESAMRYVLTGESAVTLRGGTGYRHAAGNAERTAASAVNAGGVSRCDIVSITLRPAT